MVTNNFKYNNIKKYIIKVLCAILILINIVPPIDVKAAPKTYTSLPSGYEYVTDWSSYITVDSKTALPSSLDENKEYVIQRKTETKNLGLIGTAMSRYVNNSGTCPICGGQYVQTITGTWKGNTVRVYAHFYYGTQTDIQIKLYEKAVNNKPSGTYSQWHRCELSTWGQNSIEVYSVRYREVRPKGYTVNYNPGSYSTGTVQTRQYELGTKYKPLEAWYGRTGYTQTGWSLNKDGSTLDYKFDTSYEFSKTSNAVVNLYPHWTINQYALDLCSVLDGINGDNLYDFGTADIYINGKLVANDVQDYCKLHDYNTTYEIKDIKSKDGYTYAGLASGSPGLTGKLTSDKMVRLNYTINSYNVTLNKGTGISSVKIQSSGKSKDTIKYGTYVKVEAVPKVGYTWDREGGSKWVGTFTLTYRVSSFTMPSKDVVLTASATPNTYYVKYNKGKTNGGGTTNTTSHTYDSPVTLANNGFTGMSYKITFDDNKPDTIGTVENLPSTIIGNLSFNKWDVKATYNSGHYSAGINLGIKNFESDNGATANATALWNNRTEGWGNPSLIGYDFDGWFYTDGTKVNTVSQKFNSNNCITLQPSDKQFNTTIVAHWKARTDTKYVVNHWQQNVDAESDEHNNKNFTLHEIDDLKGTSDTYVTPPTKIYEGFIAPSEVKVRIQADGSTVVNYYYERIKLTLDIDGEYLKIHYPDTNGLATFDIYINGKLKANDVTEYVDNKILWGSTYKIMDIHAESGKHYSGNTIETYVK